jgi:hypothetical protein
MAEYPVIEGHWFYGSIPSNQGVLVFARGLLLSHPVKLSRHFFKCNAN